MKVLFVTNLPVPYKVEFFSELAKMVELTVVYERYRGANRNVKWKSDKEILFE